MVDTPQFDLSPSAEQTPAVPDPSQEKFDLNPAPSIPGVDVASNRAKKFNYGLNPFSPGEDQLRFSILSGQEDMERKSAALSEDARLASVRAGLVREYIKTQPAGYIPTTEDTSFLTNLSNIDTKQVAQNPKIFFEKKFAEKTMTDALTRGDQPVIDKALAENPEGAHQIVDMAAKIQAQKEVAQTLYEKYEAEYQKLPTYSKALEIGGMFVPFKQWYRQSNLLQGSPASAFLYGSNKEQQYQYYYQLPLEEGQTKLEQAAAELAKTNISEALDYLHGIMSYTSSDRFLGDLGSAMEIAGVASMIPFRGLKGAATVASKVPGAPPPLPATTSLARASVDVLKATTERAVSPAQVLENAGDLKAAGVMLAAQKMKTATVAPGFDALAGEARTIFAPEQWFSAPNFLASEMQQRIQTTLNNNSERLLQDTFLRSLNINRLEPGTNAHQAALANADRLFNLEYPHLNDSILNIRPDHTVVPARVNQALRVAADKVDAELAGSRRSKFDEYGKLNSRLGGIVARLESISQEVKAARGGRLGEAMDAVQRAETSREITALSAESKYIQGRMASFTPKDINLFERATKIQNKLIEETKNLEPESLHWVKGLGNIDYLVKQVGDRNAQLFANADIAETTAKHIYGLKPNSYRVKQQGNGYLLEIPKAVDERAPSVLNALRTDTDNSPTPANKFTNALGWFKSANYNLEKQSYEDRVIAAYGTSYLNKALKDIANPVFGRRNPGEIARDLKAGSIPGWRKETRREMSEFVEAQRAERRFSNNQMEFEKDFHDQHGHYPDARQSLAYAVYRQFNDFDYTLRNFTALKHKSEVGLENFSFPLGGGITMKRPFIEGKLLDKFPPASKDFNPTIAILDRDPGKIEVTTRTFAGEKKLQDYMDKGYKLVALSNYGMRDLKGAFPPGALGRADSKNIRFILTRELDSAPLDARQLPYDAGGHRVYDVNHYIRQPDIEASKSGKLIYNGDKNMFGFNETGKAKLIFQRVETARKMLKDVRDAGASEVAAKSYVERNLPFTYDAFKRQFDPSKGGIYSLDHPFLMTGPNENTWKAHKLNDPHMWSQYKGIRNVADDPFDPMRGSQFLEFSQAKDDALQSVVIEGSKYAPTYKLTEAPQLDPFSVMRRATDNLMAGKYMDDLKAKAADRFIAEFGNLLDARFEDMQNNPMRYIFNTPWKSPGPSADYDKIAAGKNYLRSLKEFLNLRTTAAKDTAWMQQQMADAILGDKKFPLVRDHLIPAITDPIQWMKNMAFNAKLITPKQLFVQWSQVASLAGIEGPITTMKAFPASFYARALTIGGMDDARLLEASKHVSKFGWNAPDFIEAYRGLQKTGFAVVGRETATLDNFMEGKIVNSAWGATKDTGLWFFNKGEQGPRTMSWFAVYSKWRDANPTAKFTDDVAKQLLVKAQDGVAHMSSAAMAGWQKGSMSADSYVGGVVSKVPSLAGQFSAVNAKIFEMMVSGNPEAAGYLTKYERGRLMLTYSTLFGLPVAAGTLALGIPLAKTIKNQLANHPEFMQWLTNNNASMPEDDAIINMITNGVPAVAIGFMNGGDQPNFGERYGPGGLSFLSDAVSGDKSAWTFLLGASGSVFKDIINASEPIGMAVAGIFQKGDKETYKLKTNDIGDFLSSISATADDARKLYYALNFGSYINKSGIELDKFNKTNLAIMQLMGMRPEDVTRYYSKVSNMHDLKKLQDEEFKSVEKNFMAALSSLEQGDDQQALDYFVRAKLHAVAGGWRDDQGALLLNRLTKNVGTRLDAVGRRYAMQSPEKLQMWIKELEKRGR